MTATITELPQLEVGATARFSKTITAEDVQGFAALSGDFNPLHLDAEFARKTTFGRPVVHGMLLGSFVSRMIGMQLPGAGALVDAAIVSSGQRRSLLKTRSRSR